MALSSGTFESFFMAGFECSSHRRGDGRRLDLIAATRHDRFVRQDYAAAVAHGLRTVRDGLRWHRIEASPGRYDWSSFLPMLRAADELGVQVLWDLCHYGYPDDLDFWRPAFVDRFAAYCTAVATLVRDETDAVPFYCPVNEISYWSWAGGQVGRFNPSAHGRGTEVKHQLVRAVVAGTAAIRAVDPRARFVHTDPAINVVARPDRPRQRKPAEAYRLAQYEAADMVTGRQWPTLGGTADVLDVQGVNYYPDNQWFYDRETIPPGHPCYRPFRQILAETYARYRRPLFVSETGTEGRGRADWLRYVAQEVEAAVAGGVPVAGVCVYPITTYPGWANGRHCETGLFGPADEAGDRPVDAALASELRRQQARPAPADPTARVA